MQRQAMISSKIKFIGYYPLEKILEIGFVNSSTFQYVGVPESIYNSFLTCNLKAVSLTVSLKVNSCVVKQGDSRNLRCR